MRLDKRPHVNLDTWRGVVTFGSRRIHAIQTETVFRRLAYCGAAVENAKGSRKAVSCDGCLHELRKYGYAG